MFFRRKKQPHADQTVLTETLRSLEDLIAETPDPAMTDTGDGTVDDEPREVSKATDTQPAADTGQPDSAGITEAPQTQNITTDDLPLLTRAVYMPVPRVEVEAAATPRRSSSTDTAQQAIAKELINSVEQRLDGGGRSLDPGLSEELQDAVSASLEDWSVRTQEILLKRFTSPTEK